MKKNWNSTLGCLCYFNAKGFLIITLNAKVKTNKFRPSETSFKVLKIDRSYVYIGDNSTFSVIKKKYCEII